MNYLRKGVIVLDGDAKSLSSPLVIKLRFLPRDLLPRDLFGSVSMNVSHEIDTLATLDNWLRTFGHSP
jgi:hypothetical protein